MTGLSKDEIDLIFDNYSMEEVMMEVIGYKKIDFGTCFAHFGDISGKMSLKPDFVWYVLKSYLWAFCGTGGFLKYIQKRRNR